MNPGCSRLGPGFPLSTAQPVLASVTLSLVQSPVHVLSPLLPWRLLGVRSLQPLWSPPSSLLFSRPQALLRAHLGARGLSCPLPSQGSDARTAVTRARPGSDQVAQLAGRPGLSWCPRIPHASGDSPLSAQGCPQSCPLAHLCLPEPSPAHVLLAAKILCVLLRTDPSTKLMRHVLIPHTLTSHVSTLHARRGLPPRASRTQQVGLLCHPPGRVGGPPGHPESDVCPHCFLSSGGIPRPDSPLPMASLLPATPHPLSAGRRPRSIFLARAPCPVTRT